MKCITLYRPWAGWVARGWKSIETRLHDRFACLVGQRIGIHAGQTIDTNALAAARPYLVQEQIDGDWGVEAPGVILCTVFVDDGHWLDADDSRAALIDCGSVRRFGLYLKDVRLVNSSRTVRGHQGVWDLEDGATPPSRQGRLGL